MAKPMGRLIKTQQAESGQQRKRAWYPWLEAEREGGFSSLGVVIALSLVVTLIFTSSQVYWINSRAGDIQFAADAGALAAENVVAEYYVIARVTDSVLLSMTLFGLLVVGVSIIASCIPGGQAVGTKLMDFARSTFNVRDKIADQADPMLTELQKALPFLAVTNAAVTVAANSPGGIPYIAIALLVPLESEEVKHEDDGDMDAVADEIEEDNQKTTEAVDASDDAKKRMDSFKLIGWLADCGNDPENECMYKRAVKLAAITDPPKCSLEEWSFKMALDRAWMYYGARMHNDTAKNSSAEEETHHYVRMMYYQYALNVIGGGYVIENPDGSVDINFPKLPGNATEFKNTYMYVEDLFFLDQQGYLHGTTSCATFIQNGAAERRGSIQDLDNGRLFKCDLCNMDLKSVGNVMQPTSTNLTGFEYWYKTVAYAADDYSAASKQYARSEKQATDQAEEAVDGFEKALEMIKAKRINPHPPGRKGCIVIVFDPSQRSLPDGLQTSLMAQSRPLPPRVAISAAALGRDQSEEGNILADFLEGLKKTSDPAATSPILGTFDFVLDIWGTALMFYSEGVDGIVKGLGDICRAITGNPSSKLASWVEDTIMDSFKTFGLEPVDLHAPKPLIVNSAHVAGASLDSQISQLLMNSKRLYTSIGGSGSGTLVDMVFDGVDSEINSLAEGLITDGIVLYTFKLGSDPFSIQIPIRLRMSEGLVNSGVDYLREKLAILQGILENGDKVDVWE